MHTVSARPSWSLGQVDDRVAQSFERRPSSFARRVVVPVAQPDPDQHLLAREHGVVEARRASAEQSIPEPTEHAAEGGAHGKGWIATDTYRLLHFIVLGGGLFLLLRKPLSQALGARVKGIEDQLSELEAQKVQAEKKLAEYNQKFAQLEKQSEGIVAEYVRQGQDAKARILKEAEAAADKLQAQAQKNIESEIQRVRVRLQEEILDNL